MTTTVANKEAVVNDNPFPVLPGNESLDGSVDAAANVTADGTAEVEGEVKTEAAEESGAEAATSTDPAKVTADPAKEARLWAEQYKSPEELEVAYKHSSAEGKRLAGRVKEIEAGAQAKATELAARIAELELQVELGPEMKEPTDEELEAMGPIKAARTIQKYGERKMLAAKLKEQKESREAKNKEWEGQVKTHIDESITKMQQDKDAYPDYRELAPDIMDLADRVPWATGNPNSAQLLYYAAFGRRALSKVKEAAGKTKESADKAKLTAAAAATATAAAGAGGGTKDPVAAGKSKPKPGSDDAVNEGMMAAYARKHPSLI